MTESLRPKARLDLHIHTTQSDGTLQPQQVLDRSRLAGIDVLAITDHDLAPTLPAGPSSAGGRTIHLVHAAEVSAQHDGRELHLLVYFPGTMPAEFAEFLGQRARWRAARHDAAIAAMGLTHRVPGADSEAHAGRRALTRHHLARALVDAGVEPTLSAAFQRRLAHDTGHVPMANVDAAEVLDRARQAGGFSSWAHPPMSRVRDEAPKLAKLGLDALEASRPSLGRHGRAVVARIALNHRLAITGGSDWHGWHGGGPGQFSLPAREARPFARAVGLHVA